MASHASSIAEEAVDGVGLPCGVPKPLLLPLGLRGRWGDRSGGLLLLLLPLPLWECRGKSGGVPLLAGLIVPVCLCVGGGWRWMGHIYVLGGSCAGCGCTTRALNTIALHTRTRRIRERTRRLGCFDQSVGVE